MLMGVSILHFCIEALLQEGPSLQSTERFWSTVDKEKATV